MTNQIVITMTIKLVIGFITALISLLLWSKTRDGAWLTMVLGVVFLYLGTLLDILDSFGFVSQKNIVIKGIEILPLLFDTIPFIFFGISMLLFLLRTRRFN